MKKLFIFVISLIASQTLLAASGGSSKINSSSWSLMYGYSQNVNNDNYKPTGAAYKFLLGYRFDNNFEPNFYLRYASQKADITSSSIEGNIDRSNIGYGLQVGYWLFSALNLHVGFGFHSISHKVVGAYSSTQKSTIEGDYKLANSSPKGLLAGADLVLLQSKSFQLFTNYEYYHLTHAQAHDWEAMLGIRFYPGPSKGGGESSFFTKLFKWIFSDKK
jgi:Protochlamydia outer membrane protein